MDDSDLECDLGDSEMLDDASEETWYASPASPLQVTHVGIGDIPSTSSRRAELVTPVAKRDQREQSLGLDRICGDGYRSTSPHVDSPARLARTSEQDTSNDEITNRSGVLANIEGIFEAMADVLLNERGHLSVAIKTRPLSRVQPRDSTNAAHTHTESVQHLRFPGKNEKEAWRFGERSMRPSFWRDDTDTAQLS
jgi:hypothetical protein